MKFKTSCKNKYFLFKFSLEFHNTIKYKFVVYLISKLG